MKNSGRCSPWNFNKKYCSYTCHTLRVCSPPKFHSDHCLTHFANSLTIFRFRFFSKKHKPTQSATIILTLWIYCTEDELQSCILVWRDSKKRCVHCNKPMVRKFGRHSCVARATVICILQNVESFRSYSTIEEK